MSNLYARINTDTGAGDATRCGNDQMSATLETWKGKIVVGLNANGDFEVYVLDKDEYLRPYTAWFKGNVNDKTAENTAAVQGIALSASRK